MKRIEPKEAFEEFNTWYTKCLDSGIEPEKIIEQYGFTVIRFDEDIEAYRLGLQLMSNREKKH